MTQGPGNTSALIKKPPASSRCVPITSGGCSESLSTKTSHAKQKALSLCFVPWDSLKSWTEGPQGQNATQRALCCLI